MASGSSKADRVARAIDAVAEAFQLSTKPKWYEIFTDRYLPPKRDRLLPDLK